MMRSGNPWVVAAGFLLQFAVDPFLEWVGLYAWLERHYDFLPDDVVGVRQKLKPLMQEYAVLVGLMELQTRPNDAATNTAIADHLTDYRNKVLEKEKALNEAFDSGYVAASRSFAGLPELDAMRAQYLDLQFRAHQGDRVHAVESRKEILSWMDFTERKLSLDALTADQIADMPQWKKLDEATRRLALQGPWLGKHRDKTDWADVLKHEKELVQMLDNARYRLDPTSSGFRSKALISPGTAARKKYEELLAGYEAKVDKWRGQLFGIELSRGASTENVLDRIDKMIEEYRFALAMLPPLVGYTAEQMRDSSMALGEVYVGYVDQHADYRAALGRLEVAELALKSMLGHLDLAAAPELALPESSSLEFRVKYAHQRLLAMVNQRLDRSAFFVDEAKDRSIAARNDENVEVARKLGDRDPHPFTTPERAAVHAAGLGIALNRTIVDRLNAMPTLAKVDKDGYMGRIYRYVDPWTPESENIILGDLQRTADVASIADGGDTVSLYVPLVDGDRVDRFWKNHFFLRPPGIGGSTYADLPDGTVALYDHELVHLQRLRFEDLKP